MEIDLIPYELKDLNSLEKIFITKGIIFYKTSNNILERGMLKNWKGPYVICLLDQPVYVMFYQGQQALMDLL